MHFDLILKNGTLVIPGTGLVDASVAVTGGRIAALLAPGQIATAVRVIDCKGKHVFPGVIDPHTHIGFGAKEADFLTESRSAALGGVTGMMTFHRSDDLALSTGPWREAGEARSIIDFGFHFGVTSRAHVETLAENAARFGVTSIKVYLMYKGAAGAAKGFGEVDDALLFRALQAGAKIPGAVVGVHCENTEVIPVFREPLREAGRDDLKAWDEQSPGFLETENVFRVCWFGEKTGCPVNIVHMSAAESLDLVRRLRRPGRAPIHVETCAHYLSLSHDDASGSLAKVNPPLRSQSDIDALWEGVRLGEISTIGSDHVPRKAATKEGGIWNASAGFPGIATLLPVLLDEGWHRRGVGLDVLAAATSANVADLYNLAGRGRIAPGYSADFAIVDLDGETLVDPDQLESHSDYTPWAGRKLKGAVTATVLKGRLIAEGGKILPGIEAGGEYIFRTAGKA
ncbi:dihydroorotase family protein [Rhodobacter sp. 24-YEA-8]|uniref:dihydroorotase n=1 Tax=Rhodobacter sp. 24-YEA-8 TaxID=1884310 RepID=UPI00089C5CA6|nr:dihydroorotase family protein [Rhodobacter sp. 24-YEA-8]SED62303.1 dihydropyrimidinase/allantoinase [Rhodobacter sp. 24-YEA-8]